MSVFCEMTSWAQRISRCAYEIFCTILLTYQMRLNCYLNIAPENKLAPLGGQFLDGKFLLHTKFLEFKIIYPPRVCNKPITAYELAAFGSGLVGT